MAYRAARLTAAPLALTTATILQAAAAAFPPARQRRRFIAHITQAASRLADMANVVEFAAWEGDDEALARGEAAAALREALGDLPAQLDRSPIAKLAAAGVRPMRPPRSGAEAVLLANDPAAARARLVATLNALSSLHEQLLNLAQEVTDQLDRIDGDTDLEPTLGASEGCGGDGTDWQRRPSQIRALQDAAQQAGASWAAQDECEHDADFEPEEDEEEHDGREPSLGWRPTVDQSPAELALGAFDGDREEASEDEGVPPYQSGRRQP